MISCHPVSGHIEGVPVLAEVGSLHLEFQYLTHITGDPVYLNKVRRLWSLLLSSPLSLDSLTLSLSLNLR